MIAYVFPGQGSQYVGMGQKIASAFPVSKEVFSRASEALGWNISELCFEGPAERLNRTEFTQPAILTASIAVLSALQESVSRPPAYVAGHSLGEYTALVASGGISLEEGVKLVARRGKLMQEAVPEGKGAMAAILGLDRTAVDTICKEVSGAGVVAPANYNTPEQIVIAGEAGAVAAASKKATEQGAKRVIPLAVSVPSHCVLMVPAGEKLRPDIENADFRELRTGLINNVEAREVRKPEEIRPSLIRQISTPLLWVDTILNLSNKGVTTFVEIGPGRVLSGLIKRIVRQAVILNVEDPESLEVAVKKLKEI